MNDTARFADLDMRLGDMRAWLVLLARLHLDYRHQDREASDIAQETLADAVKYREKIENLPASELEYWLRRVLRNKVIDFYRQRRPEVTEAELDRLEADVGDSFLRLEALAADTASSPSERLIQQEERHRLAMALEKLSAEYREAVVLRDLAGWPLKEIAARLDCTIGVVAGRLRRARQTLHDLLETDRDGNQL